MGDGRWWDHVGLSELGISRKKDSGNFKNLIEVTYKKRDRRDGCFMEFLRRVFFGHGILRKTPYFPVEASSQPVTPWINKI